MWRCHHPYDIDILVSSVYKRPLTNSPSRHPKEGTNISCLSHVGRTSRIPEDFKRSLESIPRSRWLPLLHHQLSGKTSEAWLISKGVGVACGDSQVQVRLRLILKRKKKVNMRRKSLHEILPCSHPQEKEKLHIRNPQLWEMGRETLPFKFKQYILECCTVDLYFYHALCNILNARESFFYCNLQMEFAAKICKIHRYI